ncbi:MAG: hypothetical protein RL757_1668 [Bacteroidota bacterium]|jgi:hypothetical protein
MKRNHIKLKTNSVLKMGIALFVCIFSTQLLAQKNEADSSRIGSGEVLVHREIGLNATALLDRFLPFGVQQFTGPTDITFKRYRNNRAVKIGISAQAVPDQNTQNRIVLRLGVENRYRLTQRKWSYTRSWEVMLGAGAINLPGFAVTEGQSASFLGGLLAYGVEYNINQRVSLMTEAGIFAGFRSVQDNNFSGNDPSSLILLAMPPIALHLVIKIP